jgi:isoleucyl-tRNA synthetase
MGKDKRVTIMPEEQNKSSAPNFNELEQQVLKVWEDNQVFEKSLEKTKDKEPYIFYDGPPFATGLPHYGHILASTIKDAIPRYQTMKGKFVRRRWGWDCHGLPIENIVEQELKISGKKQIEELGVDKFNEACRSTVLRYASEWGKMVKRMGRWVDFENSYKTMDTSYQESVWWALKQIWDKGLIYEDRKVLLYCSRCETPISNFEVAMDNSYKDITEESVYVKFRLQPRQRILNDLIDDKTFALAWTTTPWTLPGNTALNIGQDIAYVMVEQAGEKYILAKDRLSVLNGQYETVAEFSARSLEGLMYEPLYPGVISNPESKAFRIYAADFVTTTDGTGIVHNAAMYGEDDYKLAKEKNLPREDMLDHKGQYLEMAPENLRGVFFKDADKIVLQELRGKNLVYKTENYLHSYPHCYRCGTPLFYNALPAWFINIQKVKADLLKNNETINWFPEHLKTGRFKQGIENAPDWNISRNRFWATALPFWKCENTGCKNVVCVGSVEELAKQATNFSEVYPKHSDFGLKIKDINNGNQELKSEILNLESLDLHKPYIDRIKLKCEKCEGEMSRVPEVVDCWVESGSMPFAELHAPFENQELFKQRFPADFVAEYIAQTRAWFYVMHVMSTILFGHAPFKNVSTTGNILAEDGSKMSKSKKNYPDPWVLIEKYGIDALRFYLLTSPVMNGDDINFSEKSVQEISRKVNLLFYNVWSFYRMYKPAGARLMLRPEPSNLLDQWMLEKLQKTQRTVTGHLDGYDTVKAGREIVDFINELSTWYLRRSRDRLKGKDQEAEQALEMLGYVLVETTKLLAPFMPFLADFVYRDLTGELSVHLENWSPFKEGSNPKLLEEMQLVRDVVSIGLSLRKQRNVSVRQPLGQMSYRVAGGSQRLVPELEALILSELNIKAVEANLSSPEQRPPSAISGIGVSKVEEVVIDFAIGPELKMEGLARELERQVQDLRKKSGLKVGDLVDLYYNTQDEALEEALVNLLDRQKTFISQISKSLEVEADYEIQSEVDGKAIWLGVVKI